MKIDIFCQDKKEMEDINWQPEIKQMVEKEIKEHRKQRIQARAQER